MARNQYVSFFYSKQRSQIHLCYLPLRHIMLTWRKLNKVVFLTLIEIFRADLAKSNLFKALRYLFYVHDPGNDKNKINLCSLLLTYWKLNLLVTFILKQLRKHYKGNMHSVSRFTEFWLDESNHTRQNPLELSGCPLYQRSHLHLRNCRLFR